MAELSDKDKRGLHGENYKEVEQQAQARSGVTDAMKSTTAREERYRKLASAGLMLAAIALLLVAGNLYGGSAMSPSDELLYGAVAVVLLGVVIGLYCGKMARELKAVRMGRARV